MALTGRGRHSLEAPRRSDVRRLALTIVSGGVLREQMSAAVLNRGPSARCANTGRPRGRRRARHPAPAKHSERVPPLPPLRTSPRTTPLPSLRRRHARSLAPPPAPTPDAGAPLARSPPTIRCPEAGPDDRVRRGVKRANVRSGVKQGTLGALCQHWATEGPETSTAPSPGAEYRVECSSGRV